MSYCRNCGNELAETAKFCKQCGTKVLDEQETESTSSSEVKNSSNGSIFDFVLIILAVIASVWVYNFELGRNWIGKSSIFILLAVPMYIIGLIIFIIASIRIFRKYRDLLTLKVLVLINLLSVVGLHLLPFIFSSEDQSANESISLMVDLYLIAVIIFNIYAVIRYSVSAYKNGLKILIGR